MDKGPKARAGFTATATINRHDFGVSWNSTLDRGGVVVGNMVEKDLQVFSLDGGMLKDTGVRIAVKGGPAAIRIADR